jgi:1,4-alpha-glucan branching enzyme
VQIDGTVLAHHEFARGTPCLQRTRDVDKAAFVTVDFVREAALRMEPRSRARSAVVTRQRLMQHLNHVHKSEPALWDLDDTHEGFEWIDFHDADNSVVAFMRRSREGDVIVFAVNATPLVRNGYRLGVPGSGFYREIINTDAETYGGGNVGNMGGFEAEDYPWQGRTHSLMISLPPLAVVAFKLEK